MKRLLFTLSVFCLLIAALNAQQLNNIANFNRADLVQDTLMPYYNPGVSGNFGIRTVWVATKDLDQDGKPEVLATDYQNNGRVHVMELNGNNLEIVWSSPKDYASASGSGSTPRWVRTGDLDGDGKGEIIFPLSKGSADYVVRVYEWDGINNNGYIHAIDLDFNAFNAQGIGNFRTNREVASVYDFDNDGNDELIMSNRDHRVYVLGISGDVPGFGGWVVEGGDPSVVPVNTNAYSISHWHSVPADLDGNGTKEIVSHFWNFAGFMTIKSTGIDTYVYPDTSVQNFYYEYMRTRGADAVGYMGVQPLDVDGDGTDEIAIINFVDAGGVDPHNWSIGLIHFNSNDNVQYSWDSTKFSIIAQDLWTLSGIPALNSSGNKNGSFWGIGAADLNNNGRDEILLGGVLTYDVVALEYNGSGSVLDPANYSATIIYPGGHTTKNSAYEIRDSAGVIDTVAVGDAPFVSKMFAGCDINANRKQEVFLSYQSVHDSVKYTYKRWDGSAFVTDSVRMVRNNDQVTLRMLESTVTGIIEIPLTIVTPDDYILEQNYPNPFNPSTTIRFSLPLQKRISLVVYDILGNEVKTLINDQEFEKGNYEITWDGTDNFGSSVSSGQYIYTLKYGNFSKSLKMTLLK